MVGWDRIGRRVRRVSAGVGGIVSLRHRIDDSGCKPTSLSYSFCKGNTAMLCAKKRQLKKEKVKIFQETKSTGWKGGRTDVGA